MPTTRYYLGGQNTSPLGIGIAWDASWNTNPGAAHTASRRLLRTTPDPNGATGTTFARPSVRPNTTAAFQAVSDPLPAGTIAGELRFAGGAGYIGSSSARVVLKLVSGDGQTVRARLLDQAPGATIADAGNVTSVCAFTVPLATATAQAGDRLVLEVGAYIVSGLGGSGGFAGYALTAGSDVPYTPGYVSSTAQRPWVDLILADPPSPPVLQLADATAFALSVAWQPGPTGSAPTGYQVSIDGGPWTDVGGALTYTFAGLVAETTHTVAVRAYAGQLVGAAATLEATTPAIAGLDRRWWTHRLAASVGLDPVTIQPVVEVRRWDPVATDWHVDDALSAALAGYQVTYGRDDARGDVDALRATLTLATVRVPETPAIGTLLQVRLCDAVAIQLGLDDGQIRFTGEVTDPAVDYDAGLTKLVCVGRLGRAYRQPLSTAGWPAEDDGARISRILAALPGVVDPPTSVDAGTITLAAPTRDDTAGRLVEQVTASTLGQLVEQPGGNLEWHGPNHRRGATPKLTLAAAAVFRRIVWSQRMADLVNRVTIKYAGGGQVTVDMPWSVDPVTGYGPYPASIDSILTTELDARTLAAQIVARRFTPAWQLPDLQVDLLRTVPLADLPTVLALRHGDRLQLTGLPSGCPVPDRVFVEGWTETATPRAWRWSASVSDPIQSGVAVRWTDVPQTGARTWQDVKPGLTWLDALRIENPDDLFT